MKYNFSEEIDRFHSDSVKWDCKEGELPMWVADMDFKTCPSVIEALRKRVEHGVFGYQKDQDEWYDAYISWWDRRHNFKIEKDWMVFATGVVPCLSSAVRKFTTPGEKVLIQTPVYNIFFNSIINNGREILESPLVYSDGKYSIDFEDLDKKMKDPQCSMMILCNPQNPVGKIWNSEELSRIGELAFKNNVVVVSDEIHCDITKPGHMYIPFLSVNETNRKVGISLVSPGKAFNLAGMHSAAAISSNPNLRHKIWRQLNTDECGEANTFAVTSAVAAFNHGEEWLNELNLYIESNKQYVKQYILDQIPNLKVVDSDCLYLMWIDISNLKNGGEGFADFLREKTGLWITDGEHYGSCGKGFFRINVATTNTRVMDGMERLKKGVEEYNG